MYRIPAVIINHLFLLFIPVGLTPQSGRLTPLDFKSTMNYDIISV
jgi:hypothetical protein